MKKTIVAASLSFSVGSLFAVPTVSEVSIEQLPNRTVKVSYKIDEPAVVTFDILTNASESVGASIGPENLTHVWGDVNRLVSAIGAHEICWAARKDWPDRLITDGSVKAVVKAWATNAPPDYMVLDLETPGVVQYYESAEQVPGGVTNAMYKLDRMVFRKVPAKGVQWRMGSPSTEDGHATGKWDAWETTHYVTLSEDFYMGVFELTERQRWYVDSDNWGSDLPAKRMSYVTLRGNNSDYDWPDDGHEVASDSLLGKLRTKTGIDTLDLPTEAQWEFACRAGTSGPYAAATLDEIGWCLENSGNARHKVGSLKPNAFGLYDMHGNVGELCLDWCQQDLGSATVVDPKGPSSTTDIGGSYKTVRGGAYDKEATYARSAYRQPYCGTGNAFDDVGVRLVCSPVAK